MRMSSPIIHHLGKPALAALAVLAAAGLAGCASVEEAFEAKVAREFAARDSVPERILGEADIAHLPEPVRRYVAYTGSLGRPVPRNLRIVFDAEMRRKRGGIPLPASSEQYNFLGENPSRFFFMKASRFMVPFRVLHAYSDREATMTVRVAGLFTPVDIEGEELTRAETVTLLNDMCVFAPGMLGDPRFSWRAVDSSSAEVSFANGPYAVSAMLLFNEAGELVNFLSEDRSALQDDGTLRRAPWSTPLREYKEFEGRRIASRGEAIYHYPEGDFGYGTFTVRSVRHNLKAPE